MDPAVASGPGTTTGGSDGCTNACAGVEGFEASPIDGNLDAGENLAHLLAAQDNRQLLLSGGTHQTQGLPLPPIG